MRLSIFFLALAFAASVCPHAKGEERTLSKADLMESISVEQHARITVTNVWEELWGAPVSLSGTVVDNSPPGWSRIDLTLSTLQGKELYLMPDTGVIAGAAVLTNHTENGQLNNIHMPSPHGGYTEKPAYSFTTPDGNIFTGVYADMDGDGWPDLIRWSSKRFGLFDAKALTEVSVYRLDIESQTIETKTMLKVKRKGEFFPWLNGFDLDGDGKGDLIFCDITHGALTIEQMAEAVWDGRLTLRLYGYLSSESRRDFPEQPSFEHTEKIGITKTPEMYLSTADGKSPPVLKLKSNNVVKTYFFDRKIKKFIILSE